MESLIDISTNEGKGKNVINVIKEENHLTKVVKTAAFVVQRKI
jgi:hypothetical protein